MSLSSPFSDSLCHNANVPLGIILMRQKNSCNMHQERDQDLGWKSKNYLSWCSHTKDIRGIDSLNKIVQESFFEDWLA